MLGENKPGPGRDSFKVLVYLSDENKVVIDFGVDLAALPVPADSVKDFCAPIWRSAMSVDPQKEMESVAGVSVAVMGKEVVLEFSPPVDGMILLPKQAKALCYYMLTAAAKIQGKVVV